MHILLCSRLLQTLRLYIFSHCACRLNSNDNISMYCSMEMRAHVRSPPAWEKRDAPGVFAGIILFLTQRPHSAAVVRFSNGRGTRGAGRKKREKKRVSFSLFRMPTCAYGLFQGPLFHVGDVWLFLCRRHLAERNAAPAQRRCHPEYRWRICPCALSLKCALT